MTKSGRRVDLTQGSIMGCVFAFALPLCIGNVLQQMYSTVDTLVIGNFCSATSLAAVGTSAQPLEILLCMFIGLGNGVSILVSQYTGSGEHDRLRDTAHTAVSLVYCCSVPLTVIGILLGPWVLRLMSVPEDTMDLAVTYLRIMILGTLGNLGYNLNAGILNGMGDSRANLMFLGVSCVVNIGLDLLFVAGFGMDVAGAAAATIIAQLASWLVSMAYIRRKYPELHYSLLPGKMVGRELRAIVRIGVPLGLNHSLYSFGHLFLQALINEQGSVFMAACSVAGRVNNLANMTVTSLASAATTFAGQNLGAKRYDRLYRGGRRIPLVSGSITLVCGVIVTLLCEPILRLFTQDAAVLPLAVRYVRIVLPSYWIYTVFNSILSYVNGMGQVRYTMVVNVLMLWAVRIPLAWAITRFMDGGYVMACYPVSFTFGMLCMLRFYLTPRWKEIRAKGLRQLQGQDAV